MSRIEESGQAPNLSILTEEIKKLVTIKEKRIQ